MVTKIFCCWRVRKYSSKNVISVNISLHKKRYVESLFCFPLNLSPLRHHLQPGPGIPTSHFWYPMLSAKGLQLALN